MATKKQRRRREKLKRHEYEYVVETEEGEEVLESPKPRAEAPAPRAADGTPRVYDRRGREIQPPSWRRVLKRGAIFGPILLVLVFVTNDTLTTGAKIVNALVLLLIFLPFSYLVDRFIYRMVVKRQQQGARR